MSSLFMFIVRQDIMFVLFPGPSALTYGLNPAIRLRRALLVFSKIIIIIMFSKILTFRVGFFN